MTTRNAEAGAVVLLSAGLVGLLALGVAREAKAEEVRRPPDRATAAEAERL